MISSDFLPALFGEPSLEDSHRRPLAALPVKHLPSRRSLSHCLHCSSLSLSLVRRHFPTNPLRPLRPDTLDILRTNLETEVDDIAVREFISSCVNCNCLSIVTVADAFSILILVK